MQNLLFVVKNHEYILLNSCIWLFFVMCDIMSCADSLTLTDLLKITADYGTNSWHTIANQWIVALNWILNVIFQNSGILFQVHVDRLVSRLIRKFFFTVRLYVFNFTKNFTKVKTGYLRNTGVANAKYLANESYKQLSPRCIYHYISSLCWLTRKKS